MNQSHVSRKITIQEKLVKNIISLHQLSVVY